MAVIVNGDGILTGISSLATSLTDITSGRGTVTGVATVGTLQLGAGVSISSPRTQQAAIFTNNTEFFTVDDAGRVGVGTITPNSDAHPENEKKINVGFITAKSIAGDIDARNVVVAGVSTFVGALNATLTGTASGNTTISNNADNRIITGGSGNAITGESNLTWDGTTLLANKASGTGVGYIVVQGGTSSGDYGIVQIKSGSTVRGRLVSDASVDAFRLDTAGGSSTPFTFHTGSSYTERLRINSSGKVRVGSGDPTYELEVYGSGAQHLLVGSTNASGATLVLDGDSNGDGSGTDYSSITHNTSGNLVLTADNPGGNAVMMFVTGDGNEKMRIDNGGRLLLAATSGTARLHIKGNGGDGIKIENSGGTNGAVIDLKNTLSGYNKEYRIAVAGSDGAYATASSLFVRDQTAGQTRLELATSGDFKVNTGDIFFGTAGKGIVLGNTANVDANTLDDYEEGTFTPTQPTIGTNSASGHYTKIGRYVYASIFMTLPTNSSGQYFYIDSLPFTALNNSGTNIHGGYAIYTTYGNSITVRVHDNGTRAQVSAIGGGNITLNGLDNLNFRLQVHYMTN